MQELIKVHYHLAKLGGHGHSNSGDRLALACQVTLQNHVIKGSCGLMAGVHQVKLPSCLIWSS